MDIGDLQAIKLEDGQIDLVDKAGEKQFELQKPFMVDSYVPEGFVTNMENAMPEGSWSDDINVEMKQDGSIFTLIITPSMKWLQASERVYPVTIDPTIKVYQPKANLNDTNIRSALPTTTGGADFELGVGLHIGSNNVIRTLLQFDLGVLPAGAKVADAQLNLRLSSIYNSTSSQIGLYEMNREWKENEATWQGAKKNPIVSWTNKGGDFKNTRLSVQTIGGLSASAEPPLYSWAIPASVVQNWIGDPSSNLGFMLKAENESLATYKKFYSGDYTTSLQYSPKLILTYYPYSRLGLEDYWSYKSHSVANGTGSLNLGTGNLALEFTDFSISGRGNSGFSFARTYNSKGTDTGAAGYRWSYTGSDTILELPDRNIVYTDDDGTAHQFIYNVSSNSFQSPVGKYLTLTKSGTNTYQLTDRNGNKTAFKKLTNDPEINGRIFYIDYEEDRNSNRITYVRQNNEKLTSIVDASGRTLQISYDAKERIESISFENVKKASYTYDTQGNLRDCYRR